MSESTDHTPDRLSKRDAAMLAAGAAPWVADDGMPRHLPMGVDAQGHGPTEPDTPHHRVCWCGDPECMWTRALAAERAAP